VTRQHVAGSPLEAMHTHGVLPVEMKFGPDTCQNKNYCCCFRNMADSFQPDRKSVSLNYANVIN